MNSVDCVVAPMQTGGGIQNKILEAMALGKVVLTTELGYNPIERAERGVHLLVEDSPSKMADLINQIVISKEPFSFIEQNARQFIFENYSWKDYEKKLLGMLSKSKYDK